MCGRGYHLGPFETWFVPGEFTSADTAAPVRIMMCQKCGNHLTAPEIVKNVGLSIVVMNLMGAALLKTAQPNRKEPS